MTAKMAEPLYLRIWPSLNIICLMVTFLNVQLSKTPIVLMPLFIALLKNNRERETKKQTISVLVQKREEKTKLVLDDANNHNHAFLYHCQYLGQKKHVVIQ